MPRQAQPIIAPKGPYLALQPTAGSLDFIFTASSVADFDEFVFTGRELLVVKSTGAYTFTLESVADEKQRTGDVTAYALTNGEYASFWFGKKSGWEQSGGKVYLKGSNAGILFAVVRIPETAGI